MWPRAFLAQLFAVGCAGIAILGGVTLTARAVDAQLLSSTFDDPPENALSEGGAWAATGTNSDLPPAQKSGGLARAAGPGQHGGAWRHLYGAHAGFLGELAELQCVARRIQCAASGTSESLQRFLQPEHQSG